MTEPTPEQRAATCAIFKNIVELLEQGLFFGHGARYVVDAIGYLKANIDAIEKSLPSATLGPEGLRAVEATT